MEQDLTEGMEHHLAVMKHLAEERERERELTRRAMLKTAERSHGLRVAMGIDRDPNQQEQARLMPNDRAEAMSGFVRETAAEARRCEESAMRGEWRKFGRDDAAFNKGVMESRDYPGRVAAMRRAANAPTQSRPAPPPAPSRGAQSGSAPSRGGLSR